MDDEDDNGHHKHDQHQNHWGDEDVDDDHQHHNHPGDDDGDDDRKENEAMIMMIRVKIIDDDDDDEGNNDDGILQLPKKEDLGFLIQAESSTLNPEIRKNKRLGQTYKNKTAWRYFSVKQSNFSASAFRKRKRKRADTSARMPSWWEQLFATSTAPPNDQKQATRLPNP